MANSIRRSLAALLAAGMLITFAAPAGASSQSEASNAPVVFDVLVMRPVGFVTLLVGTAVFAVSLPLVVITRPTDVDRPLNALVIKPAKFLWKDNLGGH